MLDNVLNIEGVTVLKKAEQRIFVGQYKSCFDEAWEYGTANADQFVGGAHAAMDAYYTSNCI